MPSAAPVLLIVSAPSGAGKTTLCRRLLKDYPGLHYSISCTTRAPRAGEQDGREYVFLDEATFLRRVEENAFLEFARVHRHWYGTPRAPITDALAAGRDVLMDIDVQGAAQIRTAARAAPADDPIRRAYADIFVTPPSLAALRARLEGRGQDRPDVIERRLRQAGAEMDAAGDYQFQVVNDELETAYGVIRSIYIALRHRRQPLLAPGACAPRPAGGG